MEKRVQEKEYIITYIIQEHYEVLGWVKAPSIEKAKKKAQQELSKEVKHYQVVEAEIAEWKNSDNIYFSI
jgi:hypothetical protein